jgi:hypothetical protein
MSAATTDRTASRLPATLAAGGLAVTFEWTGDRWRHRVALAGRPLVESVEGPGSGGDPRWPESPALQEVSMAETGGRTALLAVGSAGRSHFSASLTADPRLPDTVLVEIACRLVEPAGWLGSTYRDATGGLTRIAAAGGDPVPRTVCWSYRIGPGGVAPVAADAPPRGRA